MQYTTAFIAALSATGALAAPALRRDNHGQQPEARRGGFADINFNKYQCPQDRQGVNVQGGKKITIQLNGLSELARQFPVISNNGKFVLCQDDQPFNGIAVNVEEDPALENLRCAVADNNGKMIGASRGENVDFTFADGGSQAPWSFLIPTNKQNNTILVSKVVCDLKFQKIDPNQRKVEEAINVLLRERKGGRPMTVGPLDGPFFGDADVGEVTLPVQGRNKFETLEVQVGRLTNLQSLRCAARKEANGDNLTAVRGANTDTTFSDNKAGEWTFTQDGQPKARTVKEVACSSAFEQVKPATNNNNNNNNNNTPAPQ